MAKKQAEGEVREFVDKAEFDNFRKEQERVQAKMLDLLEKSVTPAKAEPTFNKEVVEDKTIGCPNKNSLLPQYEELFIADFDISDGFNSWMTFPTIDKDGKENGSMTYTISVPKKFSNAGDAYWKMYKCDLRTRVLHTNSIVQDIIAFNKIVIKNLHYNKNIKTK